MKLFLILTSLFFTYKSNVISQITYYQDVCKCGVTGAGFSTSLGYGSGTFEIFIEPGSQIKKAVLFGIHYGNGSGIFSPTQIQLNSNSILFDSTSVTGLEFIASGNSIEKYISLHARDVTDLISASTNQYNIEIPSQDSLCFPCRFNCFYLYVIYENSSFLMNSSTYISLNDIGDEWIIDFQIDKLNKQKTNIPFGFALYTDRLGLSNDGSYLSFYNSSWQQVGYIAGSDNVNNFWPGAGVKGHFYYQNDVLYGLDDDTPDFVVGGSDGLINVESFVANNSLKWRLQWDHFSNIGQFNIYGGFFLTHSTTCDTFSVTVPNDTTLCYGSTLQLNVSGGQRYEWSSPRGTPQNPAPGLNCADCPNPVFTADSSMFYTVRIWNNDSCSVVRPIKMNVRPQPKFGSITSNPSQCGTNNGNIVVNAANGTTTPILYTLNNNTPQSSGVFSNLVSGSNTLSFTDGNGCKSKDTLIVVSEINTTIAQFTVSPAYGTVPLTVALNNTSQNATDFLWSVNGVSQGNNLTSYTCDPSGVYTFELIAWQYDPSCADTFALSVTAVDRLIIPTAFTPDGDGANDFWELPNIDAIYPFNVVRVYNRWGEKIYESNQGKYASNPWKGTINNVVLPVGSYYFIIETGQLEVGDLKGSVSIVK